jgi:hypothetical protein
MFVTMVDWIVGDRQAIEEAGFTVEEVEEVLLSRTSENYPWEESEDLQVAIGITKAGKRIGVVWLAVSGNPLMVAAQAAFLV